MLQIATKNWVLRSVGLTRRALLLTCETGYLRVSDLRVVRQQKRFTVYHRECAISLEWQKDLVETSGCLFWDDADIMIVWGHQNVAAAQMEQPAVFRTFRQGASCISRRVLERLVRFLPVVVQHGNEEVAVTIGQFRHIAFLDNLSAGLDQLWK